MSLLAYHIMTYEFMFKGCVNLERSNVIVEGIWKIDHASGKVAMAS